MSVLINLTNHPFSKWSLEQREGWKLIMDLKFPNVDPNLDTEDVKQIVNDYVKQVKDIIEKIESDKVYICLQGEYTFCYLMLNELKTLDKKPIIAIPTTERRVNETVTEDGKVEKTVVFEFCKWRFVEI
ncbi:MAG: hypothetical protein ACP5G1_03750 [Nanopusillaceae archaeon]